MQEVVHDAERLKELQALPLERKIQISQARIIEWYQHWKGKVCVSFSGGKDSTVLLHLVHQLYPNVKAVFVNTGLEYPEIQKFARQKGADFIYPSMRFNEVIIKYGYPLIGKEVAQRIYESRMAKNKNGELPVVRKKMMGIVNSMISISKWELLAHEANFKIGHRCCQTMKKDPFHKHFKETHLYPYLGTTADESLMRREQWIRNGCNAFNIKFPSSKPMSFWTEQDILAYIIRYGLEIASVYGEIVNVGDDGYNYSPIDLFGEIGRNLHCTGCQRTGCMFCGFGFHLEKGETRFQRLAKTHPRQYEYCIGGGKWSDNPSYDPVAPKYDGEWKNWNPKKIWTPSEKGLGMGKLFDMVNEIYGKDFYRY